VLWWVLLGLLAAGLLVAGYAILVERRWYRLARYRLDILPGGGPLTVLHLSDLHMLDGERHKRRFLRGLPEADVTIVTGDLLGEPEAVEYVVETLRPLRGRLVSLFVLGSNDLYAPRPLNPLRYFVPPDRRKRRRVRRRRGRGEDLVAQLEADGWAHLKNRRHNGGLDGVPMEILGLDDPHVHRGDVSVSPRREEERFGLAVVHSPDPAAELVAMGWDLIVTGHTHGGQVRLPWGRALVTNSTIPRRMASGLHRIGKSFLHVSPGLGTSKYAPFRLFCRPEATLLELHAGR